MFSRKSKSVPVTVVENKNGIHHVGQPVNGVAAEKGVAALPGPLQDVDEETARYLDPSIVIDDETNRRIKKRVCDPCADGRTHTDADADRQADPSVPYCLVLLPDL